MKMDLEVYSTLRASHSLAGNEQPHVHDWKLAVGFSVPFPLQSDRVLDLVMLQSTLEHILKPYQNTYLNETLKLSPTSENIAAIVWENMQMKLKDAPLKFVRVSLCNLDGASMGTATLHDET